MMGSTAAQRIRLGTRTLGLLGASVMVGALAGGSLSTGHDNPGVPGYCENNICSGSKCRSAGSLRSNCDRTGPFSCANHPCPPERPLPLLVTFADPESARMLVESGPAGLRALVDRIRAQQPYPQIHHALTVLARMADRRWMWHNHVEARDWGRVKGVASRYLFESPPHLETRLRAQVVVAAVTLALELRDDSLRAQVQQMLGDPQALTGRLEADQELADQVMRHARELLNN